MATVVTQFPTTNATETSTGLVNPTNAYADDGSYATAAPGKNLTLATKYGTFGFGALIPNSAGVTITKVQIIYKWKCSTNASVATARTYSKVSGTAGTNHDDITEPAADTTNTYDITAERAWTRANLLDGTLEVVLAAVQGSSNTAVTFSFDDVKVEVTYTTSAPTVTTSAATSVSYTTATGNGNVTDDGGATVTERGVCWSTSSNPTTADTKATVAGTTGSYTASMTGLSEATLYHYRAYAINANGTSYGADTTFTTLNARYWIGGTGNWNDPNRWSHTSGGPTFTTTPITSYSESNKDNEYQLGGNGSYDAVGQSFLNASSNTLFKTTWYIKKTGSPTGNVVAKIYAMTGTLGSTGVPTGAALATSDNVVISTLPTSFTLIDFVFTGVNNIALSSSTNYVISLENNTNSGTDYISVGFDNSSSTYAGNPSFFAAGSWNTPGTPSDFCFYVYGANGIIPSSVNDVFIDGNSGSGTITVNVSANCSNFDATGFTGTLAGNQTLTVYKSLTLGSGMTFSHTGGITMSATDTVNNINTAGKTITSLGLGFTGTNTCKLLADLSCSQLLPSNAGFDANGFNVTASSNVVIGASGVTRTISMGSGTWTLTGTGSVWQNTETAGLTLTPGSSVIKITNTSNTTITFAGGSYTHNNIWFSRGASTATNTITGTNTFADFKDDGSVAHTITFPNVTTTVSTFTVSGSAGNLITLARTGGSGTFTLSKSSGTVSSDYLSISNSTASGGAGWYAGTHSTDGGGNTGWIFTAPPIASGGFFNFM